MLDSETKVFWERGRGRARKRERERGGRDGDTLAMRRVRVICAASARIDKQIMYIKKQRNRRRIIARHYVVKVTLLNSCYGRVFINLRHAAFEAT